MTISDETLMAFSDGELSAEERAAVELAIRENPELAKRVARHRALRDRVSLAYSAELSESVPERLSAAVRRSAAPLSGKVVNINEARVAMRAAAKDDSRAANDESSYRPGWRSLGGIAAGVLLGLGVGYALWQPGSGPISRDRHGTLIASGPLNSALTAQLAAEQSPRSAIQLGISFRDKSGAYCRSFAISGAANPVGIACHRGEDWQIQSFERSQRGEGGGEYRTAGSGMPPWLLKSIESQIAGGPLDQAAEAAARQQGWQPSAR